MGKQRYGTSLTASSYWIFLEILFAFDCEMKRWLNCSTRLKCLNKVYTCEMLFIEVLRVDQDRYRRLLIRGTLFHRFFSWRHFPNFPDPQWIYHFMNYFVGTQTNDPGNAVKFRSGKFFGRRNGTTDARKSPHFRTVTVLVKTRRESKCAKDLPLFKRYKQL